MVCPMSQRSLSNKMLCLIPFGQLGICLLASDIYVADGSSHVSWSLSVCVCQCFVWDLLVWHLLSSLPLHLMVFAHPFRIPGKYGFLKHTFESEQLIDFYEVG